MRRTFLAVLAGTALLAPLGGCGGAEPAAPADPLPPRPKEIRMDGLDPCTLMPAEVLLEARIPNTPQVVSAGAGAIRECAWDRPVLQRPSGSLGVTAATQQDVRNVLSVDGAKITDVAGFGAVEIPNDWAGPQFSCGIRVDVARGQGLWVSYFNTAGDEPGATHELMCQRAHRAAEGVMRQLLAATR